MLEALEMARSARNQEEFIALASTITNTKFSPSCRTTFLSGNGSQTALVKCLYYNVIVLRRKNGKRAHRGSS
jgi:hypothetical protein